MPQIQAKARTDPLICHINWMFKIKMAWFLTKLTVQEINTNIIIRLQVFSRCCYYLEEWLVWTHSWFWLTERLMTCKIAMNLRKKPQNWYILSTKTGVFYVWMYERSFKNLKDVCRAMILQWTPASAETFGTSFFCATIAGVCANLRVFILWNDEKTRKKNPF